MRLSPGIPYRRGRSSAGDAGRRSHKKTALPAIEAKQPPGKAHQLFFVYRRSDTAHRRFQALRDGDGVFQSAGASRCRRAGRNSVRLQDRIYIPRCLP